MSNADVALRHSESIPRPFNELQDSIAGTVVLPGDVDYDELRQYNPFRQANFPAAIVLPAGEDDVAQAVRFAGRHRIPVSVRGGGHSIAGHSDMGQFIIDLSSMRGVSIDPERQLARVQGGARSRDLAIPANEHGLALSTGDTGSVGVGGLVTGGGVGWFVRKYGIAADRLRSARIVTADGAVLTVSPMQNPDLFWAIRGGGGNYGIVVEYEFQLVPVKYVYGGALVLPATREVIRGYLEYSVSAPDELSTTSVIVHAPPAPFIPEDSVGERVFLILSAWCGDRENGERAVAPLRALAEPIADTVDYIPYPAMFQYMEWAEADHGGRSRMMFTDELPDETIDDFIDAMANATSPFSVIHFRGLGGQLPNISRDETAFVHRDKRYFVAVLGLWFDPEDDGQAHIAWVEDIWNRVAHLRDGVYCNFLSDEGHDRVREAYNEDVYQRLALVKAKYDPGNMFRFNQNIRPVAEVQRAAA
jgi:FAD/FMN-containing dehydrogenase